MRPARITRDEFPLWSDYRSEIYPLISRDYDSREIETIHASDAWHCWLIESERRERIGLVEPSLRNVVDGCLGTPVPYLEGLYLVESERGRGPGTRVMEMLRYGCQEHGHSELATDAELPNVCAQRVYERLGFELVDRVVEYRLELETT
jgi:aminoglycoside 6'-N-acetyltransferase I